MYPASSERNQVLAKTCGEDIAVGAGGGCEVGMGDPGRRGGHKISRGQGRVGVGGREGSG